MSTYESDLAALPHDRDVVVMQGDAHRDPWTVQLDGVALDLTDVTYTLTVSDKAGGTAQFTGTTTTTWTTSGVRVVSAAAGQITIVMAATNIASLSPGSYYYEVVATFPSDHALLPSLVKTLFEGRLSVRQDAT